MNLAVIENEAMKLTQTERALLADRLLETLVAPDPQIVKAWAAEGERRLERFRKGEISALDLDAVVAGLRVKTG